MTHYPGGILESKQYEVRDRKHIKTKQNALAAYYKGKNPIDVLRNNSYSYYYAEKNYTAFANAAKLLSAGNQAILFTKAKPGTIGGLFDRIIKQVTLMALQRPTPNSPQPARKNLSKLLESTAVVYGLDRYTYNAWHPRFIFLALTETNGEINANMDAVTSSVELLFNFYLNQRKPWFMYLPDKTAAIAIKNELKKLSLISESKEAQYPMPDTGLIQRNKEDFFLWQKSKENIKQEIIQRMQQRISIIDDFMADHFPGTPMIFSVTQTEPLYQLRNLLLSKVEFKVMNANNSNSFLESFDQYVKFIHYITRSGCKLPVQRIIPEDLSKQRIAFRKKVDWSLFKYGFTIPQSAMDVICSNIAGEVLHGSRHQIKLSVNDEVYSATLINVGFTNDTRKQLQVRYGASSPVAIKLKEIFRLSYDYLQAAQINDIKSEPLGGKEYVDVVCVTTDTFRLDCFPLSKEKIPQIREIDNNEPKIKQKPRMTIKESIIFILSSEQRAMTAEEIYGKIIEQRLYTFGASNPVNVVRTTIEYACDNSGYANRDADTYFHLDRNSDGKRIYSLLATCETVDTEITLDNPLKVDDISIWNDAVERAFHAWLERSHYSRNTANQYRRAVELIYRNYKALAQKARVDAISSLDATRKWIVLLRNNGMFVSANKLRHNQYTAALAAFEQFRSFESNESFENGNFNYTKTNETSSGTNGLSSSLDDIIDLEEGLKGIRQILEMHFQTLYGYSNIGILWKAAQDTLSMFLNDNAINNADDFWRFLQRAFSNEYTLSNPHVWQNAPDYPQSYIGVIINLARQFGGTVTREQIDDYFARIKQNSPINSTITRQGKLLFYNSRKFILAESVNLTSETCNSIKSSLDKLFARENVPYVVLRDITQEWFASLPAIKGGHQWTALLLQEVLRFYTNIDYRIIFSGLEGQSLDTLGVAVVPSKSDIVTFADIAHRYCFEKGLLAHRMQAEDLRLLLRDAGMVDGNELIYNLHKALKDHRFAFTDDNRMVKILER